MCHVTRVAIAATSLIVATVACSTPPAEPLPSTAMPKARFPHDEHVTLRHLECKECHHETNAHRLDTPHPEYLSGNGIECSVCHHGTDQPREPEACGDCHPVTPPSVADETLSAKVVIHETCWRCHPIGDQPNAQGVCLTCHGQQAPPVRRHAPSPRFSHRKHQGRRR